uniref:IncQ plasmid conjugative transfer DNA nicking endonuclease TraR (PTi VirD2-like protein) n=1 Tax=Escherichia coli TaxID=562 RepID=A0A3G1QC92_ECOLX|nr:IncQ plasmid conjugative transfer DNA nicking endonuclease TraR (pTi VirD2-like protein) [Escherichia coli]
MGVYVDKEFRVKRKSSEAGRKSAFAHKVKNGGKNYPTQRSGTYQPQGCQ